MNDRQKNKILTIPNLLSFFRLCLIPLFVWLNCEKQSSIGTGAVLVLSGATDMVDGYIARHFNAVSDLGKILDPVADKLTQVAMLFCLLTRFPLMWAPLALLIAKEMFMGLTGLLVIRKTKRVYGAKWHGKVATCLLYAMMIVHVVWPGIPRGLSNASIALCIGMMVVSVILYGSQNIQILKGRAAKQDKEEPVPQTDEVC